MGYISGFEYVKIDKTVSVCWCCLSAKQAYKEFVRGTHIESARSPRISDVQRFGNLRKPGDPFSNLAESHVFQ